VSAVKCNRYSIAEFTSDHIIGCSEIRELAVLAGVEKIQDIHRKPLETAAFLTLASDRLAELWPREWGSREKRFV
jgi:hypothetical protein